MYKNQDLEYGEFQYKLIPGVDRGTVIGVRVPVLRKIAKEYVHSSEAENFLGELPHQFYDENMLHGMLISEIKDYNLCIKRVNEFLPFVDNWAVCDTLVPKVFKKNKQAILGEIYSWVSSKHIYTCRFGIGMLMRLFLDDEFEPKYLEIPANVKSDEYYVNMMIAWFFATALAKQWDSTIPFIEDYKLSPWVHNKTIQKAKESYRVSDEHKQYLNGLKIKKI